jgi:SapC
MYKSVEIINLEQHKNIAAKELTSVAFAKSSISAPIGFAEFYEVCRDYPIFFAKDAQGQWFATAIFGYKDENLFIDNEGKWKAGKYIPAFFRRYPFILVKTDDENFSLAFDSVCGEETNESNAVRAFFEKDGSPSEFTKNAFKFLLEIQNEAVATEGFIKDLESWGLLEEKSAQIVSPDGNTHVINGFFTVNEQKLAALSDKKRSDICKKGAIPLITAHLISLGNIQRLTI